MAAPAPSPNRTAVDRSPQSTMELIFSVETTSAISGPPRSQVALRDAEGVDEPGAGRGDVVGRRVRRAQQRLQVARRGRQEPVRRGRGHHDHIQLARLDPARSMAMREASAPMSAAPSPASPDPPLPDPGPLPDPFVRGVQLLLQVLVRHFPRSGSHRPVATISTNGFGILIGRRAPPPRVACGPPCEHRPRSRPPGSRS
jgi:hypothetical protein